MSNDHPQPLDAAEIPRFAGIPTFMRLPAFTDPAALQVGLIGVPWDGGTTNRAGARHGPREVRNLSSLMRKVHHVSRIAPYDLVRVGDLGDAPVNPIDLLDSLRRIEGFYRQVHAAGTLPLSVGGDHLVTLPIFRALGRERTAGHGAFRCAFRYQRPLLRRQPLHPRHAIPPSHRGRPARSAAHGADRHPRLGVFAGRRRFRPRVRHPRDPHGGVRRTGRRGDPGRSAAGGGRRADLCEFRRRRARPGLRARHRHPGDRRHDQPPGPAAGPRPARAGPGRRRRGGSLAAVRCRRRHGAGGGDHDVRAALPACRV